MSDVAERVKKIVVEHLGVDESKVTENASFIDDLGADSLDTVELVMAFEEEFGCEIPDDAAEKIMTVKDAVQFIESTSGSVISATSMRRVVVTGVGLVTPLGVGTEHVWKRLIAGESGIRSIQNFDVSDLPAKIAGQVPRGETAAGDFNADDWVPPKDQRKMDEFIIFAMARGRAGGRGFRLEARGRGRSRGAPA